MQSFKDSIMLVGGIILMSVHPDTLCDKLTWVLNISITALLKALCIMDLPAGKSALAMISLQSSVGYIGLFLCISILSNVRTKAGAESEEFIFP